MRSALIASLLAVVAAAPLSLEAQSAASCDRACLAGVMTAYLDSLVANRMNTLYLWNGHPFASLVMMYGVIVW